MSDIAWPADVDLAKAPVRIGYAIVCNECDAEITHLSANLTWDLTVEMRAVCRNGHEHRGATREELNVRESLLAFHTPPSPEEK